MVNQVGKRFWYQGHLYEVLTPDRKVVGVRKWVKRVRGTPKQIGKPFPERAGGVKGVKKSVKYKPKPMKEVIKKEEMKIQQRPEVIKTRKGYTINPLVRSKYNDYIDGLVGGTKLEERRKEKLGQLMRKGKVLPMGALQKYFDSRRNFYEINGVQRDIFEDKFAELDMVGVDGWLDLDGRLAQYFGGQHYKSQKSEMEEYRRKDKELDEAYKSFVESTKRWAEEDKKKKNGRGVAS